MLEASNKELLCPITSIHLVDTIKLLQIMRLVDWWKSDFKKKGRFKKKNGRDEKMNRGGEKMNIRGEKMKGGGEKMNIRGEKMISELTSCLKLKKYGESSK